MALHDRNDPASLAGITGATERRVGVFEQAHRGTLFLDEVANLSRNAQARLHRVVEYQTFQRIGGTARAGEIEDQARRALARGRRSSPSRAAASPFS